MILRCLEHESWNEKDNDYTGKPSAVFMNFINHSKCVVSIVFSIHDDEYKLNKNYLITDEDNLYFVNNNKKNKIKKLIKKYISNYNLKYKTNIKDFYTVDKTNINKVIKYEI